MTIYKYRLDMRERQTLPLPRTRRVLHVGLDPQEEVCIWAEVDTSDIKKEGLTVFLVPTGAEVPSECVKAYNMGTDCFVGTFVRGAFVGHIYAMREKQ